MITKTLALTLLTFLSCMSVSAQQNDPWKKFTSADGKFSVLIPCTPEITSEDVVEGSVTMKQVYHNCLYGKAAYGMSYSSLSAMVDPKTMLDKFRDGILKGSQSTIINEKDVALSSYPGREFSTKGMSNATELHYEWRIYAIDKRVYSVSFITRTAESDSSTALKFLSSFSLEK